MIGLIDLFINNSGNLDQMYADFKNCISTLSPLVRNRLNGLPSYVLDYSDLITSNSVEKPFIKIVMLIGPSDGYSKQVSIALYLHYNK